MSKIKYNGQTIGGSADILARMSRKEIFKHRLVAYNNQLDAYNRFKNIKTKNKFYYGYHMSRNY